MSVPYRTVFHLIYRTVFYRDRNRYRTVFRLTVRSVKRTEPLVFTVLFFVFEQNWCGTVRGTRPKLVRCIDKRCNLVRREPYRTNFGAVRFAVPKYKWVTVPILAR